MPSSDAILQQLPANVQQVLRSLTQVYNRPGQMPDFHSLFTFAAEYKVDRGTVEKYFKKRRAENRYPTKRLYTIPHAYYPGQATTSAQPQTSTTGAHPQASTTIQSQPQVSSTSNQPQATSTTTTQQQTSATGAQPQASTTAQSQPQVSSTSNQPQATSTATSQQQSATSSQTAGQQQGADTDDGPDDSTEAFTEWGNDDSDDEYDDSNFVNIDEQIATISAQLAELEQQQGATLVTHSQPSTSSNPQSSTYILGTSSYTSTNQQNTDDTPNEHEGTSDPQ